MSANLTNYISTAVFSFFGSREKVKFSENKSIYDNFASMCSLPCFKSDSEATLKLKKIIEQNNFTYDKDLNNPEKYNYTHGERKINAYISKLENIRRGLDEWRKERMGLSSRFGLMQSFERSLSDFVRNMRSNSIEKVIDLRM
jgi:hypothetical protein